MIYKYESEQSNRRFWFIGSANEFIPELSNPLTPRLPGIPYSTGNFLSHPHAATCPEFCRYPKSPDLNNFNRIARVYYKVCLFYVLYKSTLVWPEIRPCYNQGREFLLKSYCIKNIRYNITYISIMILTQYDYILQNVPVL